MKIVDIVILVIVILIIAAILYFNIYKNRKSPCKGCSYAKKCVDNKKNCHK